MNPEVMQCLENTYALFQTKCATTLDAWDRFIEFIAADNDASLLHHLDQDFPRILADRKFRQGVNQSYSFDLIRSDFYDHLGDLYVERVFPHYKRPGDSCVLQSMNEALVKAAEKVPATDRIIRVLDPGCGTGRKLMCAYKLSRNGLFFGVERDIRLARIAMTNCAIHGLKSYILNADPEFHEIDITRMAGLENWHYANQWRSQMDKLNPRVGGSKGSTELEVGGHSGGIARE